MLLKETIAGLPTRFCCDLRGTMILKHNSFWGHYISLGKESNKITVKPQVGTDLQQNRGLRVHNATWVKCYLKH